MANPRSGLDPNRNWKYLLELILITVSTLNLVAIRASAQTKDHIGKEFFLAFLPNADSIGLRRLILTSALESEVTIHYPVNSPFYTNTVTVTPDTATLVDLPVSVSAWSPGTPQGNAVHVFSEQEFGVTMVNREPASGDAALALPLDTYNTDFIVLTFSNPHVIPGVPAELMRSQFVVVAPFDETLVHIEPAQDLVGGYPAGLAFEVILDRGEGFLAQSGQFMNLTGSIVTADRPITVLSGNTCTTVPGDQPFCSHVFEVALPVQTWGREALLTTFANSPMGSMARVVAAEDDTLLQAGYSLNRGESLELELPPGNHRFLANRPIFVSLGMVGSGSPLEDPACPDRRVPCLLEASDPASLSISAPEQFLPEHHFSTLEGFPEHSVQLIVHNDDLDSIQLDGTLVGPAPFTPISGLEFSAATLSIAAGTHRTNSLLPHAVRVSGFRGGIPSSPSPMLGDPPDSYAYPAGTGVRVINSNDLDPPVCSITEAGPGIVFGTATDTGLGASNLRSVGLAPGESNLVFSFESSFTPGDNHASWSLGLLDLTQPGRGTIVASDLADRSCFLEVLVEPVDPNPPFCGLQSFLPGLPLRVGLRIQDLDSGVAQIIATVASNASVEIPSFDAGTTDALIVTANRLDPENGARIQVEIQDVTGNKHTCHALITDLVRETGPPETALSAMLPSESRTVRVINGTPGFNNLVVSVNQIDFRLSQLVDGQLVDLDISSALHEGGNQVQLKSPGSPGSFAWLLFWDGN